MSVDEQIAALLDRMTGRPESFGPEVAALLRKRRAERAEKLRQAAK